MLMVPIILNDDNIDNNEAKEILSASIRILNF